MTKLPTTKDCFLELNGIWLTIWFDRTEKRNALSPNLLEEIQTVLSAIRNNQSIRGLIFRGKGNVFCAGMDLDHLKKLTSSQVNSRELAVKMSNQAGAVFEQISKAPQFTVSVVEGAAMAGAFGIMCSTDIIITSADARYALTETKIGLTPAQIAPYVINRLGFSKAKKLMLLGNIFDGKDAYKMGMADFIGANSDEIESHLKNIKKQLQYCAPNALAVTKQIINETYELNTFKASDSFAGCVTHEEGIEGLASFFEKRKPFWNMEK